MIYAVLASGQSMSQAVADSVRGKCKVIAVSDTWQLAPWADALVSADAGWWRHKAPKFEGPRYTMGTIPDIEKLDAPMGTNSGLLGVILAVKLGATKVLLLGVDLHGTHFFGNHPLPLRNPKPDRLEIFKRQFAEYKPKGVEILNCNPDSALTCYPMAKLEDVLPKTKTTPFNVEDYLNTPEERAAYEEELTGESEDESMAEPAAPDSGADKGIHQGTGKPGLCRPARGYIRASARRRAGQLEQNQGGGQGG